MELNSLLSNRGKLFFKKNCWSFMAIILVTLCLNFFPSSMYLPHLIWVGKLNAVSMIGGCFCLVGLLSIFFNWRICLSVVLIVLLFYAAVTSVFHVATSDYIFDLLDYPLAVGLPLIVSIVITVSLLKECELKDTKILLITLILLIFLTVLERKFDGLNDISSEQSEPVNKKE